MIRLQKNAVRIGHFRSINEIRIFQERISNEPLFHHYLPDLFEYLMIV